MTEQRKVFQISTDKPNFIEEMFQGQEVEDEYSEIDINAGETNFTDILTPMSEGFMGIFGWIYQIVAANHDNA